MENKFKCFDLTPIVDNYDWSLKYDGEDTNVGITHIFNGFAMGRIFDIGSAGYDKIALWKFKKVEELSITEIVIIYKEHDIELSTNPKMTLYEIAASSPLTFFCFIDDLPDLEILKTIKNGNI